MHVNKPFATSPTVIRFAQDYAYCVFGSHRELRVVVLPWLVSYIDWWKLTFSEYFTSHAVLRSFRCMNVCLIALLDIYQLHT
jgi:hypothetical protein